MKYCSGLLVLSLVTLVISQTDWSRKPFVEWSTAEVKQVLNQSPWVKDQEVRIMQPAQSRPVAGAPAASAAGEALGAENNTATVGGAEIPLDFIFTLRLRSALPVRQALVRQKMLEANYDRMNPKDRAAFEQTNKGLLDCPACAENYVVTLSSRSRNSPGADAVFTVFKGARLAELKRYVFIANEDGQRRELVHFVAPRLPGDEAIFFFPRFDYERRPLFTPDNRWLTINFTDNQVNINTNFKIDVTQLVVNGEVLF